MVLVYLKLENGGIDKPKELVPKNFRRKLTKFANSME